MQDNLLRAVFKEECTRSHGKQLQLRLGASLGLQWANTDFGWTGGLDREQDMSKHGMFETILVPESMCCCRDGPDHEEVCIPF